jgi:hypothetical protein
VRDVVKINFRLTGDKRRAIYVRVRILFKPNDLQIRFLLRGRHKVKKLDFLQIIGAKQKGVTRMLRLRIIGGDEEDRTPGLGIANAALSQLSYIPDLKKV